MMVVRVRRLELMLLAVFWDDPALVMRLGGSIPTSSSNGSGPLGGSPRKRCGESPTRATMHAMSPWRERRFDIPSWVSSILSACTLVPVIRLANHGESAAPAGKHVAFFQSARKPDSQSEKAGSIPARDTKSDHPTTAHTQTDL